MDRRIGNAAKNSPPKRRNGPLVLFGRCHQDHRVRLGYLDRHNAAHGEPYVQILVAPHVRAYRVTCPLCGDEFTVSDAGVERVLP
jgi:hypothetical protein